LYCHERTADAHLGLLSALCQATTFEMNAELAAGQWLHLAWNFPLHSSVNVKHEAE